MADYLGPNPAEQREFKVTPEMVETALQYYRDHRKYLMEAAATAMKDAISHRNCNVGCCLMAIHPQVAKQGEYAIYTDHNVTPAPNLHRRGKDKRCAERNNLERAIDDGCRFIPAMVTVSNFVDTGDPSKAHDVLHPCKDCRDLLRELVSQGILSRESMFCSANDVTNGEGGKPSWRIEEMTVGKLLDMYQDDLS
jgi:cytidine deaminase